MIKVIDTNGNEYVFNSANFVVQHAAHSDLYTDSKKTTWVAQIPNTWAIIPGHYSYRNTMNNDITVGINEKIQKLTDKQLRAVSKFIKEQSK